MKEATGELNMTVITIIMIGAILAFFWFMWSNIKTMVNSSWDNATDPTDKSYNNQENTDHFEVENNGTTYTMTW